MLVSLDVEIGDGSHLMLPVGRPYLAEKAEGVDSIEEITKIERHRQGSYRVSGAKANGALGALVLSWPAG